MMGGQTLEVRHFTRQAKQTSSNCHLIGPHAEENHRGCGEMRSVTSEKREHVFIHFVKKRKMLKTVPMIRFLIILNIY